MSRQELVTIVTGLNATYNLGIERVSRLTTEKLEKLVAKYQVALTTVEPEIAAEIEQVVTEATAQIIEQVESNPPALGVIEQIEAYIRGHQTFTLDALHSFLCPLFPNRQPEKIMATLRTQVPSRFRKRGFNFTRDGKTYTATCPV